MSRPYSCEHLPSFSSVDKHDDLSFFESIKHDEEFNSPSFHTLPSLTHVIVMSLVLFVWKLIDDFPLYMMLSLHLVLLIT